ncbi:hypothetical protein ACAM_1420 [Aeropyrum camini SY1 = JCM 12091]|uniref:Uncharacterized protein n=2 Tax=Aeropyrum camini TaxID=229980 RepID=U3THR0_9CREN|nr:hypothetical protein ACAM_1420 [Aeropyrum camini SY1 = JCM 12091]
MVQKLRSALLKLASATMALALLVSTAPPVYTAQAYEKDTHYYLTYYLALATCFEPIEARIIASANMSVDLDSDTSPLPGLSTAIKKTIDDYVKRYGRAAYVLLPNIIVRAIIDEYNRYTTQLKTLHSMGSPSEVASYLSKSKSSVHGGFASAGPTQGVLVGYGVYLHAMQDSFAHTGYSPPLGHAVASIIKGRDPDSLASDPKKTESMIRSTVKDMLEVCNILKRTPRLYTSSTDPALSTLSSKLVKGSDPAWKWFKFEADPKVMTHLKRLIEKEISALPPIVSSPKIPPIIVFDLNGKGSPVTSAGGLKTKGVTTDPPDLALTLLNTSYSVKEGPTIVIEADVEVFNMGDVDMTEDMLMWAILLGSNEETPVYSASAVYDTPLAVSDRRTYTIGVELSLPDSGYTGEDLVAYIAVEGGNDELSFSNNYALIYLSSSDIQKILSGEQPGSGASGGGATSTSTVTVTETSISYRTITSTVTGGATATVTKTETFTGVGTYTTTIGTITKTLSTITTSIWSVLGLDTRTLIIALAALIVAAAVLRLLLK